VYRSSGSRTPAAAPRAMRASRLPGYHTQPQRRDGACQPEADLPISLFNPN